MVHTLHGSEPLGVVICRGPYFEDGNQLNSDKWPHRKFGLARWNSSVMELCPVLFPSNVTLMNKHFRNRATRPRKGFGNLHPAAGWRHRIEAIKHPYIWEKKDL